MSLFFQFQFFAYFIIWGVSSIPGNKRLLISYITANICESGQNLSSFPNIVFRKFLKKYLGKFRQTILE
jgi:hypothetical protein